MKQLIRFQCRAVHLHQLILVPKGSVEEDMGKKPEGMHIYLRLTWKMPIKTRMVVYCKSLTVSSHTHTHTTV